MDERGKNEEEKRKKRIDRFKLTERNPRFVFDKTKPSSISQLLWFTQGEFEGPVPGCPTLPSVGVPSIF